MLGGIWHRILCDEKAEVYVCDWFTCERFLLSLLCVSWYCW